jgi:hypothetical protein
MSQQTIISDPKQSFSRVNLIFFEKEYAAVHFNAEKNIVLRYKKLYNNTLHFARQKHTIQNGNLRNVLIVNVQKRNLILRAYLKYLIKNLLLH